MYLGGMDCNCHGLSGLASTSSDNAAKTVAGALLSYYTGGASSMFGGAAGGGGAGAAGGPMALQNTNASQNTNTNTINPNVLTNVSTQVSPVFSQNQGSPGSSVTGGQSMPVQFTPSIVQPIAVTPSMTTDPSQSQGLPAGAGIPQMQTPFTTPVTGLLPGFDTPTYQPSYQPQYQPVAQSNNMLIYAAIGAIALIAITRRGGTTVHHKRHKHGH